MMLSDERLSTDWHNWLDTRSFCPLINRCVIRSIIPY